MKNFTHIFTVLIFFRAIALHAQTTLISPTGDGGFENGSTFAANGWAVDNGSQARTWVLGTFCTGFSGTGAAYISQDGTNYADGNSTTLSASVVHIYRNVTFPPGETHIQLSFKFKQPTLDVTFDFLKVYLVNPSTTPVAGTALASGQIGIEYPSSATASFTTFTITIPAANAGTTKRLVFSYTNDDLFPYGSGGIDDISLVSSVPGTYYWTGGASGSWATSTNWSPTRTTPNSSDNLIINATNNGDNTTTTLTAVPTQTIGSLQVAQGVTVNLQSATASNTLTIVNNLNVPASNTLNINGANSLIVAFSSGAVASIAGTLGLSGSTSNTYNPTNSTTTVTGTVNNGGIVSGATATNLIFSAGSNYNHTRDGGTIPTAAYAVTSNCNVTGAILNAPVPPASVGNFTWNCTSQTGTSLSLSSALSTINGTCNVLSTGSGGFHFGVVTTLVVNGLTTISGGTLLAAGGTLSFNGGLTQSGGSISGTFPTTINTTDLTQNAGTISAGTSSMVTMNVTGSFTQSGTLAGGGVGTLAIIFNGSSAQTVSFGGTVTTMVSYRLNNAAGMNLTGTIPVNSGASMTISNGIITGGAVTYTGNTSLVYNGSTAQLTTSVEFPAASGPTNLTINNTAGVALHASRTLAPPSAFIALTLNAGVLNLGANDLSIGLNGTLSFGLPSANKMVQADGIGQLKKTFAAGDAASFTFPIGDVTGTAEYSPITIDFATNSVSRTIGVRVTDDDHPGNSTSDRISRYWSITNDQAGTYTYTGSFTYVAADIVGAESSMRLNRWNGSGWTQVGSTAGSNALTISQATNETAGTLGGNDFTGRTQTAQIYTWNQTGTASFATPGNWTPSRGAPDNTDILVFNNGSTTTANSIPATQTIAQLLVSGNTNVTLTPASTSTLTIGGTTGTDLDVAGGSTLNIAASQIIAFATGTTASVAGTVSVTGTLTTTNSVTTVTGAFGNNGTITSTASNLTFSSGSFYNHNFTTTGGVIPTATWSTGSTVQMLGYTTGGPPTGLSQTFSNFTYNCTGQSAATNWSGSVPTAITGTLTIASTNSQEWRLGTTQSPVWIVNNFTQTGGTLSLASNSGNATIRVSGTFNQSGGTITEGSSGTTNNFEFNGSSAQSVTVAGTISNSVNFTVNNPTSVNVTGTLPIGNGATLTMAQGAITGLISYNATASTLAYNGSAAQTTTDAEFPNSNGPTSLTINNAAGVSLHAPRTLAPSSAATALTLTAGILTIGNNDLTIGANGTISVATPGVTKMVLISGTGQLKKTFPSGSSSAFTFPIGENTGTTEYSPISFTFSANSTQRTIGISVVDADPPSNTGSTAYISRYWPVTNSAVGTYTYSGTMDYTDADINGAEASLLVQFYNGIFYTDISSSLNAASNRLNITSVTNVSTAFDNSGNTVLTGRRSDATPYVWNGSSSGDWGTAANWTPIGIPGALNNVTINAPGANPLVINSARSVTNLVLNGTGTFTLNAATTLTVTGTFTYDNSSGASASLNCISTIDFAAPGAITIPALSYGNLTRSASGATTLSNTGTIGVCSVFTPGAATYTTTGSTIDFTGSGSQTIPSFSFNNLSNSGGGARNINNTIGIAGTYIPTGGTTTASSGTVTFNGTSAQAIPASNYFNLTTTGSQAITLASSGNIDIAGAFTPGGSNSFTTTGSTIRFTGISGSGVFPVLNYNNVVFISSGAGTWSIPAGATISVGGNLTVTTSSTLQVTGTSVSASSNVLNVTGNLVLDNGGRLFLINNSGAGNATVNVTGNLTIQGTGRINLEPISSTSGVGVINVTGNFTSTGTTAASSRANGVVDFGSGTVANNAININGNFNKSGTGTFGTASTSAAKGFVFTGSGTQTFDYTGANSDYVNWVFNSGTTVLNTNLVISALTGPVSTVAVNSGATLSTGTFVISGGVSGASYTINSGATFKTANATGLAGAITATGTKTYSSGANYEFQGAATGTFVTSPTALTVNGLAINNSGGDVTMSQAFTVTGALNMTAGRLLLGANTLNVTGTSSVAGFSMLSNDASSYVVTNGAGLLTMSLASGVPRLFPIGLAGAENTFNPIQLTNTGAGGNFSVKLDNTVDNTPPDPTRIVKLDYEVTSAVTPISLAMSTQWEAVNQAINFSPSNPVVIGHFTGLSWEENPCLVFSNGGTHPFYASTIADFISLSPFTPANALALPLELNSFTGETKSSSNILRWETFTEKNVQYHIVERSTDGINWTEVGRKAGQMDSQSSLKYELEDRTPPAKAYYRLRSVDFDGQENLSSSILLTRKGDHFGITAAFPSPTKDKVTVQFSSLTEENVTVRITDITGLLVLEQEFAANHGINEVPVQLAGVQAGVYLVSISTSASTATPVRIVKE